MLTMPTKYIGLDLECTGSNFNLHSICQLGLATRLPNGEVKMFSSDVGRPAGRYLWEDAALKVNGFTHERIQAGPSWDDVNPKALDFLAQYAPTTPQRLRTVGWNVAAFDLKFVENESPALMSRLHYRHVELNSINDTVAVILQRDADKVKKQAKMWAGEQVLKLFPQFGQDGQISWHDAGFDAAAALFAWQWYIRYLKSDEFMYSNLGRRILDAEAEEAQAKAPEVGP